MAVVGATSGPYDQRMANQNPTVGRPVRRGVFLLPNLLTTGTLFSTAAFSGGNQSVNSGDTLKVTYTVSATSS